MKFTSEVVNKAIDYIMQHISEEISLEDVAEHCHFSKFYFCRVFKAETGESPYAFIKRVRMEQSAFRIKVEPNRTITDIGNDYGYTPSNYSSVFKQHLNMSPVDFRKKAAEVSTKHPFYNNESVQLDTFEECKKNITIEKKPDIRVIYERRKNSYQHIGEDWCDFLIRYEQYMTPDTLMIERNFDDPSITSLDNCIYDICISTDDTCPLENTMVIQGGKFAVYHFTGTVYEIYSVYQTIFNIWLPQSNYELDERYGYDIYREVNAEAGTFRIDMCLPIK